MEHTLQPTCKLIFSSYIPNLFNILTVPRFMACPYLIVPFIPSLLYVWSKHLYANMLACSLPQSNNHLLYTLLTYNFTNLYNFGSFVNDSVPQGRPCKFCVLNFDALNSIPCLPTITSATNSFTTHSARQPKNYITVTNVMAIKSLNDNLSKYIKLSPGYQSWGHTAPLLAD